MFDSLEGIFDELIALYSLKDIPCPIFLSCSPDITVTASISDCTGGSPGESESDDISTDRRIIFDNLEGIFGAFKFL